MHCLPTGKCTQFLNLWAERLQKFIMNYIWSGMIIISFISAAACGKLQSTLTAGLRGAESSFEILLSFAGIMCFWSGMLKIAQESGISKKCEKLLNPVICRLFPKISDRQNITMNIIANLLGMGNAATPAGIAAMRELNELNGGQPFPSREMCRFAVINTASLQIFPTTAIGILSACGSKNPFSIVPCIWISSIISLCVSLFAEQLLSKRRRKK